MVRLRQLVLFNFRTFKGRHVVDLPESGIVILRGANRDTRGDSGAGKTNVLLAIAYAFGFCPYPQKDLQCWWDDASMYVEVHLDTDGGPAVLTRGAKLSLKIGDKTVEGSAKAVEARLDALCGVNSKLREAVTYRDQVEPMRFLDMKDAELKQFLVQVLHLEGLEKEIEAGTKSLTALKEALGHAQAQEAAVAAEVDARRAEVVPYAAEDTSQLEVSMAEARVHLERLQLEAEAVRKQVLAMENEVATVSNTALLEHSQEIRQLQEQLKAVRFTPTFLDTGPLQKARDQLELCRRHKKTVQHADDLARTSFDEDTESLRARLRHLHNELAKAPSLMDDISRLSGEAEQLKANVCDRCLRVWEEAQRQYEHHAKEIEAKKLLLEQVCVHRPEVERLEAEVRSRDYEPDKRLAKFETVERELEARVVSEETKLRSSEKMQDMQRQEKLLKAEAALGEAVSRAKSDAKDRTLQATKLLAETKESGAHLQRLASEFEMVIQKKDKELSLMRLRNQQGAAQFADASARLLVAEKRLQEASEKSRIAEGNFKRESDYVEMLRGFRNKIFDEVLSEIGDEATALVGSLPNAAHTTIEFQSERTTDAGTTRQEIKPVAYLHGTARPLKSSVSGGQLTSVSLAVDLAVGRVISRRLGCNLGWVILDEAFNGHDTITKASCLELLRAYAQDRLVMVVDHASEFKELVTQVITVEYKDKVSRFS